MKKLIVLDPQTFNFTEIDHVKSNRLALELRSWLLNLDPGEDSFGFLENDLPIAQAVLNGSLPLPYRERQPHLAAIVKGVLPQEYLIFALPFYDTIRGVPLEPPRVAWKDGKRCAWATFEDANAGWRDLMLEFVDKVSKKLRIQRGME